MAPHDVLYPPPSLYTPFEDTLYTNLVAPKQFTCRNCGGGDRVRVAIYRPFGEVSLSLNRTVTCIVLKANDRRTSCPCHDEFRGPRSDYVRQVALATTTSMATWYGEGQDVRRFIRQLPPVRSTPIYKQPKQTIIGPILMRNLKFYELNEVMHKANQQFSSILAKFGNVEQLDEIEITLGLVFIL
ncbi:uncharacterized protein TNCV_5075641 [Trichonephila clavipes]|uniref:Uncharacterized protein n=1 Tax=Trichonephila clavipes TaxID=2585209 RepID=A0A8X6RSS0_TRICX|nr:uncharacterized protein TNCV_5075641 [Trichonephila clavipes]